MGRGLGGGQRRAGRVKMEFGNDTNSGEERERCSCAPQGERPLLREITNEPTAGSCPECGGESGTAPGKSGGMGLDYGFVRL